MDDARMVLNVFRAFRARHFETLDATDNVELFEAERVLEHMVEHGLQWRDKVRTKISTDELFLRG